MTYYGWRKPGSLTAAAPGDTIIFDWASYNDSGASIAPTGVAVTDIEIFRAGLATARATDSGYSLISDTGQYGNSIGMNRVSVQLFNTTSDTGFYDLSGDMYSAWLDSVTIDARTVRVFLGSFNIGNPDVNAAAVSDTGLNNRTQRILDEVDTGIRSHVDKSDTGIKDLIAELDTGLRGLVADIDTGIPDAVWNYANRALSDTGAHDIADLVWDEVLSGATHNVVSSAGRRLRTLQDFGVYEAASVWVDEVAGTSTGTTDFEDATVTNRATDFDNAQTVAASVGIDRIHIQENNFIALTAGLSGYNVWGYLYHLNLGGQTVTNSTFENARISGVAVGSNTEFQHCIVGDTGVTDISAGGSPVSESVQFTNSAFRGTVGLGDTGDYRFVDCTSGVAGPDGPIVDITGNGAKTMEFRRWSGGLNLKGITTGDNVSVDVVSGGTIQIGGTGGTFEIRGTIKRFLDTGASGVSINTVAALNQDQVANAVWDEADTGHRDANTMGWHQENSDTGTDDRLAKIQADTDTGTQPPTLAQIVDGVWDEADTGHRDANSMGWHQENSDTGTDDRLAKIASDVDTGLRDAIDHVDTGIHGYIPTPYEVADALLNFDMAEAMDSGTEARRTVLQALRFSRNRVEFDTGTYIVFKENDSTSSHTGALSRDTGAAPIKTFNPT